MRKLAFLFVAFSLVAIPFYGCDETTTSPLEPTSDAIRDAPSFNAEPNHSRSKSAREFTFFIFCTDIEENVDFVVSEMCQSRSFYDANGGYHSGRTCSTHGKGIGQTSGSKWVFSDVYHVTFYVGPNEEYPRVANRGFVQLWQGTGGMPSFKHYWLDKITLNANGEMTVDIEKTKWECEGHDPE